MHIGFISLACPVSRDVWFKFSNIYIAVPFNVIIWEVLFASVIEKAENKEKQLISFAEPNKPSSKHIICFSLWLEWGSSVQHNLCLFYPIAILTCTKCGTDIKGDLRKIREWSFLKLDNHRKWKVRRKGLWEKEFYCGPVDHTWNIRLLQKVVPLSRNRIDNDNNQQKQLERKLLLGTWNCHKSDKTIGNWDITYRKRNYTRSDSKLKLFKSPASEARLIHYNYLSGRCYQFFFNKTFIMDGC